MTLAAARGRRTLAGLALLLTGAAGWQASAGGAATPLPAACATSVPFRSGTQGYHTFRIPAVVRIGGTTVLAFAEGRRNSGADDGDIDVVLRRSYDGGCTWEPLRTIADAGTETFGNPAPVVDPRTGRVVLLICRDTGPERLVYELHSDSGGLTWSPPRDITSEVKPANWRWYATGPGHAIALRSGPHAGRLLVPANHTSVLAGVTVHGAHALYSDNGGQNWHIGFVQALPGDWLNLNESTMAELPGGRVYVNSRDDRGFSAPTRADAYSSDGGLSIDGIFRPQGALEGPEVQGSVLHTRDGALLYSGPADPAKRRRMTLRVSGDQGASWTSEPPVSERPAAYSDLVELADGTVGLLYETGTTSPYESLTFARLTQGPNGWIPTSGAITGR
ncbi:sialidase family protein [Streptomyces sp. PA03-1a]|nr:sialidase family protein [Streptomyces sp. PA03-1a]MDX2812585.1 sialidase family protein [Streptomyces sp. PA03-5A]